VQAEAYAPLHVRAAPAGRTLHLVADNTSGDTTPEDPS